MVRIYLDTSVLISACRGKSELAKKAFEIIDDPENSLVLSDATRLELLPKPLYQNEEDEVEFYENIFCRARVIRWNVESLDMALKLGTKYGLSAMDAIHIANAIFDGVDEFVTAEKETKPLFRVQEIKIRTISVP